MILMPTITYSLLYLFVCLCNGAPPKQVGQSSVTGTKYTDEEDEFIVQELLGHLDGVVEAYCNSMWDKIQIKHRDKWIAGTQGFRQERTSTSLRNHFREVLIGNGPQVSDKVPEALLQKMNQATEYRMKEGRERKLWYSKEEDDFIFEELLKPYCTTLTGIQTISPIVEKHKRQRLLKTRGFENARQVHGIRSHLLHLKKTGQLPKEVADKFQIKQNGSSTSTSTTEEPQRTNVRNDQWIEEWIKELHDDTGFQIISEEKGKN